MHCYVCAERGIERTAVGLCRSCYAGLCLEHLRDTAAAPERWDGNSWTPDGMLESPRNVDIVNSPSSISCWPGLLAWPSLMGKDSRICATHATIRGSLKARLGPKTLCRAAAVSHRYLVCGEHSVWRSAAGSGSDPSTLRSGTGLVGRGRRFPTRSSTPA
jgi:hypothetical protein